jgi:hypothetical protein
MSDHAPKLAFDLDQDLRTLSAMASSLTPYLYEKDMYGYLSGDLPRLTLGGLLMRLYRLGRLQSVLTSRQRSEVENAQEKFETERKQWSVHYEQKLQHELEVRIDALLAFLAECGADLQSCAADYPTQAEKRIMIEHLAREARRYDVLPDKLASRLEQADTQLRRLLSDGEFLISDARLKEAYSRDPFWWLYGNIAEGGGR